MKIRQEERGGQFIGEEEQGVKGGTKLGLTTDWSDKYWTQSLKNISKCIPVDLKYIITNFLWPIS